jgi:hypothetical protein
LNLDGTETFDITGLESVEVQPRQDVTLTIHRAASIALPPLIGDRRSNRLSGFLQPCQGCAIVVLDPRVARRSGAYPGLFYFTLSA